MAFPNEKGKPKLKNSIQKEDPTTPDELTIRLTLEKLERQFPEKTMLGVGDTARAIGLKNAGAIHNGLRKNAVNPFPVPHKKVCGKLYFNIVHLAAYMAGQ